VSSYRTWVWLTGIAITLVAGISTWLYAGSAGKPHLMDQNCSYCHLGGRNVDPARADRLIGSQEWLCSNCHKDLSRRSHPSGFIPKGQIAADLPLDWKGDMTCSTCHEAHGTQPGLIRGNKRGKALCLSCHDAQFFAAMKDGGLSLQQSGHAGSEMASDQTISGIDALSLECMGCHNMQSDATGVRVGGDNIVRHNSGGANHPIGIPYPLYSSTREYRDKSLLPKEIWLPKGKLSCVSCHSPYKKKHGQLVMPNNRSSLCIQCHDL